MAANVNSIQPLSDPFTFSIPARGTRGTASAVPLVLLPLSPTLASRQNCCRKPCRKDTGGTPCAILFPVFSTEHLWGRRYFRNTKKTARTRHTKAARWFQ